MTAAEREPPADPRASNPLDPALPGSVEGQVTAPAAARAGASQFYPSLAAAIRGGAGEALGVPAIVLAASYLGFGSLCRESGFTLWLGLASTATGWALPGQIAMVELYATGATLAQIALAVGLVNARLLPMAITWMPVVRHAGRPAWRYYLAAHYVAVTGWAIIMQRGAGVARPQRLAFFLGLTLTLWTASLVATALGFYFADTLPEPVNLGLVFLNPIYFMLIFVADLRHRLRAFALVAGAIGGPLLHLVLPKWDLLLAGLLCGTLAFLADRALRRRGVRHG